MVLVMAVAAVYGLAMGVVVPGVRKVQAINATPTATPVKAEETPDPTQLLIGSSTEEPEATSTPEPTPTSTPVPTPTPGGKLWGKTIGIDPARGYDSKVKGVSTGIYANRVNFYTAELIKAELEKEGATVVMTYTDVTQTPTEESRVKALNNGKIDIAVRIDVNSVNSASTRGAMVWVPASHEKQKECEALADTVLNAYVSATGMPTRKTNGSAVRKVDDKQVLNETSAPIINLFLGHISNKTDDTQLNDDAFKEVMVKGIVDGIIAYFG